MTRPHAPLGSVVSLPTAKVRREQQLVHLWAEADRLEAELRAVKARTVPLQRQVSLDRGYLFTVSREKLALAMKGKP